MVSRSTDKPLVDTLKNLCKVCYTCVRECPVKAIKIINGQAEVISERCIACGNCVQVCSQGAKVYYHSEKRVRSILDGDDRTVACIAPSFPAEFSEISDYRVLIAMIRKLGFDYVTEVSFGADLIAGEYQRIFDSAVSNSVITSDCPAIVNYIESYHPDLVENLAPVDSPAMAMAKVVKKAYGEEIKTVFIGPCIAKKSESQSFTEVLTFAELREMFLKARISSPDVGCSEFDPPFSGRGSMFAANRGLLQNTNRKEGFDKGDVIVAEGRSRFIEAVRNLEEGVLKEQHLELLCCSGCIQGPGMTKRGSKFLNRKKVNEYVVQKLERLDKEQWKRDIDTYSGLNLSRSYSPSDQRSRSINQEKVNEVLISMGRSNVSDMLNCGACGYETCLGHATAVVDGLAQEEMCLPYAIEKLHESVRNLNESNRKLAYTKQALKQSEKLASMGQVSAGIAHELNNPLGVITLYSSILKEEINKENPILNDILIIDEQAERCKRIVNGLLNFARKNQVNLEECNIINFINHSFKSVIVPESVTVNFEHNIKDPVIKIDTDQMIQVLTNIFKNAVEAMPDGGRLNVKLEQSGSETILNISDTGTGIPKENIEKIFTPFFTTKEPGKGTGLGLPLAYGIIKMHKGKIRVTSNCNPLQGQTGTLFTISLPG